MRRQRAAATLECDGYSDDRRRGGESGMTPRCESRRDQAGRQFCDVATIDVAQKLHCGDIKSERLDTIHGPSFNPQVQVCRWG